LEARAPVSAEPHIHPERHVKPPKMELSIATKTT